MTVSTEIAYAYEYSPAVETRTFVVQVAGATVPSLRGIFVEPDFDVAAEVLSLRALPLAAEDDIEYSGGMFGV